MWSSLTMGHAALWVWEAISFSETGIVKNKRAEKILENFMINGSDE